MHIEGHVGIGRLGQASGQRLDGIIVRGENAQRTGVVEFLQEHLGQRAAQVRVRAASKFVHQAEGVGTRLLQQVLHFGQLGRIRRELVFDALGVANVHQNLVHPPQGAGGVRRNQQPALQHQLKEAQGFQSQRLAPRVGAGYDHQSVGVSQGQVQGNHGLSALCLHRPEHGIDSFYNAHRGEFHAAVLAFLVPQHRGQTRALVKGKTRLGIQKVQVDQALRAGHQRAAKRGQLRRQRL